MTTGIRLNTGKPVHGRFAASPAALCGSRSLNFAVISRDAADDPPDSVTCTHCRTHRLRRASEHTIAATADELLDLVSDDIDRAATAIRGNAMAAYDDIKRAQNRIYVYRSSKK